MLKEKAQKIQLEIGFYKKTENQSLCDVNKAVKIENDWCASYLFADLLEESTVPKFFSLNRQDLNIIHQQFLKETGCTCDLDDLFKRNWLRHVNNKIHIAGIIRWSVHDIEKVKGLEHEHEFLKTLDEVHKNKFIAEADFFAAVKEFEKRNNISLDLHRSQEAHWFEVNNSQVKIHNLSYHEPLFQYADDFLFIKKLHDLESNRTQKNLVIAKPALERNLAKHRARFPLTPSLQDFLEMKFLETVDEGFVLNLRYSEIPYDGMIQDKVGALFWEKILNTTSFADDRERLHCWYECVVHRNHWCQISSFFESKSKDRFLDAALDILLSENDLVSGEEEYMKLKIDSGHRSTSLAYILAVKNEPKFPSGTDLFYLYEGLKELDHDTQGQLFHHQESRCDLTYFIQQIVRNDRGSDYKRIFQLLESGPEKTFLLWETAEAIHTWKPEILPLLALHTTTSSLAFSILDETRQPRGIFNEKAGPYKDITSKLFDLLCQSLAHSTEISTSDKARIIYQCLLTIENEKFKIIGPDPSRRRKHKEENVKLLNAFQNIFQKTILPGTYYSSDYASKKLWYPAIFEELIREIKTYNDDGHPKYQTITLPFVKLDMFCWTLSLAEDSNDDHVRSHIFDICQGLLSEYLERINTEKRPFWDYETTKMTDRVPVWSNQHPNVELIDWGTILIALEKEMLLDDFLSPAKLKFYKAKDKYDELYGFTILKIRTHLYILLLGYNKIYEGRTFLEAKGLPAHSTLEKIESKISFLITAYSKDDPVKARLDIFSHVYERTFWSADREELLPVIGNIVNRFKVENKNKIIRALVQAEQMVRAFKLLDYLISENDKKFLLTLVSENDIQQFFSSSYPNDAEYVLQKLAEDKSFVEKARQALDIWEHRELGHYPDSKDQHLIMCFRLKLLLAYHDLDVKKIEAMPSPVLRHSAGNYQFAPYATKDFYKALIYLYKDEPKKAYKIFDRQLNGATQDRPTLALNRFAAKLQWADQTAELVEKRKLFSEALEEWNVFEKKIAPGTDLEFIKDKIWYNRLHAYSGLRNDIDFDSEFNELDRPFQLRPDFLELRIKNFMERYMQHQAEIILSEAEDYHRLNDGSVPEALLKLREITDSEETERYLQEQYRRIFSRSPEQLIKILPGNVNSFSSLNEFLLCEIVGAATDMLTFSNSVSEIKKEDKFSDLMVLSLVNRLRNFAWHIGPARGGYPGSSKLNPGLIDYAIWAPNKERIAICEALQLHGINRTEIKSHNFKIFNYDPSRKLFFVIVYYRGDGLKLSDNWEGYKTVIEKNALYPPGFELNATGLEDLSKIFGTNSVMVAKGKHGDSTLIYHVYININYLKQPAKKGSKKSTVN